MRVIPAACKAALTTLFVLSAVLLPTEAKDGCFDSLDPIVTIEQNLDDDSNLRTYIICPNTVFDMADTLGQNGEARGGHHPLMISRSNIHILCGEDGKSENKCVFDGGQLHVGFFDKFQTGKPATNTLIQGITFRDSRTYNVMAENEGDLTLIDCIFEKNRNMAGVYAAHPSDRRRHLFEVSGENTGYRKAQEDPGPMKLVIKGCAFVVSTVVSRISFLSSIMLKILLFSTLSAKDNIIWPYSGLSVEGLVSIEGERISVEISHTTFVGTKLESAEVSENQVS